MIESTSVERLVVAMAREINNDDVVVVGVGTPVALAATLLARESFAPDVTIMMPGALNPRLNDISSYLQNPSAAVKGAAERASRVRILDAIRSREVTLQFIRPAQVDANFHINTEVVSTPRGEAYLVGPVALPDVLHLIKKVIAYVPHHDTKGLVPSVYTVTAPRWPDTRGVSRVITPRATLAMSHGVPRYVSVYEGETEASLSKATGFKVGGYEGAPSTRPTPDELAVLRARIDPLGLLYLEDPFESRRALDKLTKLWAP